MILRLGKIVAAAAAVLVIAASAVTGASGSDYVGRSQALNDLNAMRATAGVPRVSGLARTWNAGCRRHNKYMAMTGDVGHAESRSSGYYTRGGAAAAANSVIAMPGALPSVAWGDSVYHRLALLQPRLRRSGFDASYGFTCMRVFGGINNRSKSRTAGVTLYPWPANGSQGAAPVFEGNEYPDPLADAPGATELGTPLTVGVNGPWQSWLDPNTTVSGASLVADDGTSVAVSTSDDHSANRLYLQGGFALLPRTALAPDTWYSASATGKVVAAGSSYPFSLSWRFQTGPASDW